MTQFCLINFFLFSKKSWQLLEQNFHFGCQMGIDWPEIEFSDKFYWVVKLGIWLFDNYLIRTWTMDEGGTSEPTTCLCYNRSIQLPISPLNLCSLTSRKKNCLSRVELSKQKVTFTKWCPCLLTSSTECSCLLQTLKNELSSLSRIPPLSFYLLLKSADFPYLFCHPFDSIIYTHPCIYIHATPVRMYTHRD